MVLRGFHFLSKLEYRYYRALRGMDRVVRDSISDGNDTFNQGEPIHSKGIDYITPEQERSLEVDIR